MPFTVVIPPAERVPDLGRRLVAEHAPAVLAWLVRGAVLWYRDGLGDARAVTQATFDYRQREDVFATFLAECTVAVDVTTSVKLLRSAWLNWARESRAAVGRHQDFTRWLEMHGVDVFSYQGARWARGVGLRSENPGSGDVVRTREDSPGNFPYKSSREKCTDESSRVLTSPVQGVFSDDLGDDFFSSTAADVYLDSFDTEEEQ